MQVLETVMESLGQAPWLLAVVLLSFLSLRGANWPWTRWAGFVAVLGTASLLVWFGHSPHLRPLLVHPERLAVWTLLVASAAVTWKEMRGIREAKVSADPLQDDSGLTRSEWFVATLIGLVIVGCALAYPARLGVAGDQTPSESVGPWFLAGFQELSRFHASWFVWGALPLLLAIGLLCMPYLEPDHSAAAARRSRAIFLFAWLFVVLWPMAQGILLSGTESESALDGGTRSLSQTLWLVGLERAVPTSAWLRELPVAALLAVYFGLFPWLLLRWKATRRFFVETRDAMGAWRFHSAVVYLQVLLLVPLKMYGRWLLNVDDWIHLPEWSFHF